MRVMLISDTSEAKNSTDVWVCRRMNEAFFSVFFWVGGGRISPQPRHWPRHEWDGTGMTAEPITEENSVPPTPSQVRQRGTISRGKRCSAKTLRDSERSGPWGRTPGPYWGTARSLDLNGGCSELWIWTSDTEESRPNEGSGSSGQVVRTKRTWKMMD